MTALYHIISEIRTYFEISGLISGFMFYDDMKKSIVISETRWIFHPPRVLSDKINISMKNDDFVLNIMIFGNLTFFHMQYEDSTGFNIKFKNNYLKYA